MGHSPKWSRPMLLVGAVGAMGVAAGGVALLMLRRRSLVYKLDREICSHLSVGGNCDVVVVRSLTEWEAVVPRLRADLSTLPFVGLDCEWVSDGGRVRPVSLLQLSTYSGLCLLVRLHLLSKIPPSLKDILTDTDIIKVGVAVLDDRQKLLLDYQLEVASCLDLRHLALNSEQRPDKFGLDGLANKYLGVKLDKDWRLRAGNWEAEELTPRQVRYAANDSLVAVNILWVLLRQQMCQSLSQRLSSWLWGRKDLTRFSVSQTERYLDLPFSNKDWRLRQRGGEERGEARKSISPPNSKLRFDSVRKSPLYHNCQLEAPDGQMLCTCDVKKAEWYIRKGIGDKISDNPFTVRLRFEPSGRPEGKAGEYYLSVKPNICVVCGKEDSYLRKNIVPHEYRRYFPAVMKDHQSHDVLLMCVRCHQISNIHDAELRQALAQECGAPIGTESDVKVRENFELKKVKSAGRALKNDWVERRIPSARREELEQILVKFYRSPTATREIVEMAADCNFLEMNSEYTPHSRAVVHHYLQQGGLLDLEVRWRKHFLRTMKPKFLPNLWSVNHQEERLGVKAAENRIDKEQYLLATQGVADNGSIDLEEYRSAKRAQLGINPEISSSSSSNRGEVTTASNGTSSGETNGMAANISNGGETSSTSVSNGNSEESNVKTAVSHDTAQLDDTQELVGNERHFTIEPHNAEGGKDSKS